MHLPQFLAGLSLVLAAASASAVEIRLGSLALDWPAGYTLKTTQSPFTFTGPEGTKVSVTVMPPNPEAASSVRAMGQLQLALEQMLISRAKLAGKPILPMTRETWPDGTALRFTVNDTTRPSRAASHLLQYALIAVGGDIAYLTFEGDGEAMAAHHAAMELLRTLRWNKGDASVVEHLVFTQRVAGMLKEYTGAEVEVVEPLVAKIGSQQIALQRIHARCSAEPKSCDGELKRYVSAVAESVRAEVAAELKAAVRVIIRTADFAENIAQGSPGALPARLFMEGLVTVAVVDSPGSMRMLTESDCRVMGLTPAQAYELGLANLRQTLPPLADIAVPVKQGTVASLSGDAYGPSRLLLLADWAALAQAQGGKLIVSMPARDLLLYGADHSPAGVALLRKMTQDARKRSLGKLSDVLLRWTEAGWQLVR